MASVAIIYIINEISKYFELSIKRAVFSGCEIGIIDKYHLTAFTDIPYYTNENIAIASVKSDYICFLTDLDVIRTDFLSQIDPFLELGHNIYEYNSEFHRGLRKYEMNYENFLLKHSTTNKIYKRQWIMDNFLGFDLTKFMYNINHIFFNYVTLAENKKLIYNIPKSISCSFVKDFSDQRNYKVMYHRMLENLKMWLMIKHVNFFNKFLTIEDMYLRRICFE